MACMVTATAIAAPTAKTAASAKASAPAPLPPAPPAQEANPLPSDYFLKRAQVALDATDTGQAGSVWDGASIQMRTATNRTGFIVTSESRRRQFGIIETRDWTRVERVTIIPAAQTATSPARAGGTYVSVSFVAKTRLGKQVNELASFVLDQDGQWRLAGIVGN